MHLIQLVVASVVLFTSERASDDPIAFGKARFAAAAGSAAEKVEVVVEGKGERESYAIAPQNGGARVTAADAAGAMYGLLELAERTRKEGARALSTTTARGAPYLNDRGLNVFLTLPWNYEKNDTDYDPAALVDPERWWFQNDDYWTTLLDEMAESRLNWLDIHGTWDVSVTDAPNLYAYFIQSEKYPEVGVAPEIKAKDLERLNRVIEMAHARAIRVSLMAYEARLTTPHRRDLPYKNDEATAYEYTREMVEKMIRQAPKLDAIGFRIGESGHGADFFRCYTEAVAASGRDIPLLTRSWITRKATVTPLARASSDFTVEIKYNGEQWGAPYLLAGGRVPNWYSYSFEDYLSDSGQEPAAKMWPGHVTNESGGASGNANRWADEPYKIVWQVRANGTHRIFPFYEPEWVRRSIEPMKMGTANGYTVEPMNAYYPASPKYYVAKPDQIPCKWIHQRDELFLMQWGRLGYDPKTPDAVFEQRLAERFGAAAPALSKAWRAASRVVPLAFLAHAFGPDHRDHAAELEWGGSTRDFIEGEGLDTHAIRPVREEIALLTTGGRDGRASVNDVAERLDEIAATVDRELPAIAQNEAQATERARLHELAVATQSLAELARYYAGRFRAAWWTALADSAPGTPGARARASEEMNAALDAWTKLASTSAGDAAFYRPFTERLRMHTNTYGWQSQLESIQAEAKALHELALATKEEAPKREPREKKAKEEPALPRLTWTTDHDDVVARLPARGVERAWLLTKLLPSSTFFHKIAMTKSGENFEARFAREPCGHLLAAEVEQAGVVHRVPDFEHETPWLAVPSRAGATPLEYSSEEALAHLDPKALDPEKHGLLVVGPRGWNFFKSFDAMTQRKLLDAVARGMTLLVMQQDYTSGRYPLGWLPDPPKVENFASDNFDPGGQLKLSVARAPGLVYQRFGATPGWELPGNGTLAHRRFGKGEIWMIQARLIQNLHYPDCARALLTLLRSGGIEKPVILVDAGSEGARYATSVLPDFMNAHDVPFLTLGEVVAKEEGPASASVKPGRPWDDTVLRGRGAAQQQAFVDAQARAAAARPLATTMEEFEAQRPAQKKLVMQCLGLDPLPPRTPLNARITDVIERDGYKIEKLVFESRPGFYVTAHLYSPKNASGKLPVIVHPHGHWQFKKSDPTIQQIEIQQALDGYLALVIDSPGFSFEGDVPIERRPEGTHFDLKNLLGSMNTTAVYVWDMMRALDWLETRPDADMTRVGITGASGGGLGTLWAFAADERFKCAVPVCFPTSLEIEPHNGCQCNHVPGTLRIGDRSDALAVRAPAPIFILGADQDSEFPPEGTRKTAEKLAKLWSLFGKESDVAVRVFHSHHDYNLEMTAAALGFFDKYLKGVGDGSPLKLEAKPTEPAESRELVCLPEIPKQVTTMRELAVAELDAATKKPLTLDPQSFVAFNGGMPSGSALNVAAMTSDGATAAFPRTSDEAAKLAGSQLYVTFESEKGLTIPAILWLPNGKPRAGAVLVRDGGKAEAELRFGVAKLVMGGFACLAIDPRGFGELDGIDVRLLVYRNQSPAFAAAIDVNRAVELLRPFCGRVAVIADGAAASLAALSVALTMPELGAVVARNGMKEFADAFADDVPLIALQPQADRVPPLSKLRDAVKAPAQWSFRGGPESDLYATLLRLLKM